MRLKALNCISSAAALRGGDTGNDAVTLISTTRPPEQPHIVKNMATKKVQSSRTDRSIQFLATDSVSCY